MVEATNSIRRGELVRQWISKNAGFPAQACPFGENHSVDLVGVEGRSPMDGAVFELAVPATAIRSPGLICVTAPSELRTTRWAETWLAGFWNQLTEALSLPSVS